MELWENKTMNDGLLDLLPGGGKLTAIRTVSLQLQKCSMQTFVTCKLLKCLFFFRNMQVGGGGDQKNSGRIAAPKSYSGREAPAVHSVIIIESHHLVMSMAAMVCSGYYCCLTARRVWVPAGTGLLLRVLRLLPTVQRHVGWVKC